MFKRIRALAIYVTNMKKAKKFYTEILGFEVSSADKGYSPDFVPALIRNRKGLVAWVYGNGPEPYWPGQDEVEE